MSLKPANGSKPFLLLEAVPRDLWVLLLWRSLACVTLPVPVIPKAEVKWNADLEQPGPCGPGPALPGFDPGIVWAIGWWWGSGMSTIMMLLVRNSPELRCGCLCHVEGRGRNLGVGSILTSANTAVSLTWHFTRPPPCLQDLTFFPLSQILTRFWDPPVAASRIPVSCHLRPSPLGLGQYPKENLCRPQTSPAERAGLQVTSHWAILFVCVEKKWIRLWIKNF